MVKADRSSPMSVPPTSVVAETTSMAKGGGDEDENYRHAVGERISAELTGALKNVF